ncbi:MAG: A/G-specific adenine glycosylase [Clostridia bacterium]|nr:A/G-specific adenine glycosylase [Clostridia bacterium]
MVPFERSERMETLEIRKALLSWYDRSKRALPWRGTHDPYEVWVSEVMLQQTRTETVERYYGRFLEKYPNINRLADSSEQDVLKLWEGLGYYRRARALRQGAKEVAAFYGGIIPDSYEGLLKLSGIGEYTAGAIASIAYGEPVPAVDGNAVRVFSRLSGYTDCVDTAQGKRVLQQTAAELLDPLRPGDFNQAVMDLGSRICTPKQPACMECPLRVLCACGDMLRAEQLPQKKEKKKQNIEVWDVLLIRQGNRIAVHQRKEKLLADLWVFPMEKHSGHQPAAEGILTCADAGTAKHVFSHIIWEMHLWCLTVTPEFDLLPQWKLVTVEEMEALPFPSAMRAARTEARKLMANP